MDKKLNSKNIDTIIHNVCNKCGISAMKATYNKTPPSWAVSTYHSGICDFCGEKTSITETRDFDYPDFNMISKK